MIEHVFGTEETYRKYPVLDYHGYKEVWFMKENGDILAVIDVNGKFVCLEGYKQKILSFNRKEKLKNIFK